jgi:hypothetical protein
MSVKKLDTSGFYDQCRSIYSWRQIAGRTEKVYDFAMEQPIPNSNQRMKTGLSVGLVLGVYTFIYLVIEAIMHFFTHLFLPEEDIDIMRNFNYSNYNLSPLSYGDHLFQINSK